MYQQPPTGIQAILANKRLVFIGGGVIVALILIAGIVLSTGGDPLQPNLQHLVARYDALSKLTLNAPKLIQNDELNKFNSEANLLFNSDDASFSKLLTDKYGSAELPQDVIDAEATASSDAKLTEASLLGTYDDTYKLLMDQKLVSLQALLDETRANANSSSTLSVIKTARDNSTALRDRLKQVKL
ncbi:MAG TPA: hypothetical protein VH144_00640 [Candidatus Saccharimonadales bacterium]|jgi:hypothetical protein|nr:hypothetical protein [Candidatus Saccharimonadales bacterium]